jgi:hypothetical protein
MKTNQSKSNYRRAFIIETVVGAAMLGAAVFAYIMEQFRPELRGSLAWGFMVASVICLFLASIHYSSYKATPAD